MQIQRKCYFSFIVWMSLTKLYKPSETVLRQLFNRQLFWICVLSSNGKMAPNSAVSHEFCTKNFSPVNDPIWFDFCFGLLGKRSLGRHNCRQQMVALECVIKMKIVGLIETMFTYLYCFLCILIGFCATCVRPPVWRTGSQCSDFWGLKLLDSLSGLLVRSKFVLIRWLMLSGNISLPAHIFWIRSPIQK